MRTIPLHRYTPGDALHIRAESIKTYAAGKVGVSSKPIEITVQESDEELAWLIHTKSVNSLNHRFWLNGEELPEGTTRKQAQNRYWSERLGALPGQVVTLERGTKGQRYQLGRHRLGFIVSWRAGLLEGGLLDLGDILGNPPEELRGTPEKTVTVKYDDGTEKTAPVQELCWFQTTGWVKYDRELWESLDPNTPVLAVKPGQTRATVTLLGQTHQEDMYVQLDKSRPLPVYDIKPGDWVRSPQTSIMGAEVLSVRAGGAVAGSGATGYWRVVDSLTPSYARIRLDYDHSSKSKAPEVRVPTYTLTKIDRPKVDPRIAVGSKVFLLSYFEPHGDVPDLRQYRVRGRHAIVQSINGSMARIKIEDRYGDYMGQKELDWAIHRTEFVPDHDFVAGETVKVEGLDGLWRYEGESGTQARLTCTQSLRMDYADFERLRRPTSTPAPASFWQRLFGGK